ncbi:hypothetical protein FLAVO9AF_490003 [Flavobacterium sp. 9AF]|nr:hypothetical protein FLAVO9AF_490003 [Flavobacterium sp. 9AF]
MLIKLIIVILILINDLFLLNISIKKRIKHYEILFFSQFFLYI